MGLPKTIPEDHPKPVSMVIHKGRDSIPQYWE